MIDQLLQYVDPVTGALLLGLFKRLGRVEGRVERVENAFIQPDGGEEEA